MRPWALVALVVLGGCSPERSSDIDANPSPLCGNNVVDSSQGEECDDGSQNGIILCTRQCKLARLDVNNPTHIELGFESQLATSISYPASGEYNAGLAYAASDLSGVHVLPGFRAEYFDAPVPPSTIVTFPVSAPPIALAKIAIRAWSAAAPIWIESSGNAVHMFVANFDGNVVEVPFGFESQRPTLLSSQDANGVVILENSSSGGELVVSQILMRSPTDFDVRQLRVPSPGQQRGTAIEATYWDAVDQVLVQRLVQFFDDTQTFVAVENRQIGTDSWSGESFALSVAARGSVPFKVVAGQRWYETCLDDTPRPEITHPAPFVVVTDSGDLYISAFVDGEQVLLPYGHALQGTSVIGTLPGEPVSGAWLYEPDGHFLFLGDSDCEETQSSALQAQRFLAPQVDVSATYVTGLGAQNSPGIVMGDWYVFTRGSR